ncbi:hypothetical protein [Pseudozobellia sp. WGM2]|uniref:hypothetical protein n=1 Tax=Pseudozobellia sp. WGM2 TaxID=2787625 RepID=UPI001ADFD8BD|nr:hypothetical protein [Pseudozobellia sp. WGM2]
MIQISTVNRRHGEDPVLRIPEFINRLNQINSRAILYTNNNRTLQYRIVDIANITNFDRNMMRFIDDDAMVPLRFVSRTSEFVDSHFLGTVDIDDLLGGSNHSFQLNLLHILEERFRTPDYAHRRTIFDRPHQLAIVAERNHLRQLLHDQSVRYTGERERRSNGYVFTYRSDRGYRIEHLFQTANGRVTSDVFIIQNNNRTPLNEFLRDNQLAN